MGDQQPTQGVFACEECGGAHYASRLLDEDGVTCPRCGNDSFTKISEPRTL